MNKKIFYFIIPLICISVGLYYIDTSYSSHHNFNNDTSLSPIYLDNKTFQTIVEQGEKKEAPKESPQLEGTISKNIKKEEVQSNIVALFSPRDDIRNTLIKYIENETVGIICAAFRLTDTSITKSLQSALERKIKLTFIVDREGLSAMHSKLLYFVGGGTPVYFYPPLTSINDTSSTGLMHNKILLFIGQKVVITGSFNYTKAAQDRNRENVVIIKDTPIFDQYQKELECLMKESSLLEANQIKKYKKSTNKK
jgi:phosphatidylserine/phosphatidylglycerophosphate/cardiolipin synthase-like enzyme